MSKLPPSRNELLFTKVGDDDATTGSLIDRLKKFLPQIEKANADLESMNADQKQGMIMELVELVSEDEDSGDDTEKSHEEDGDGSDGDKNKSIVETKVNDDGKKERVQKQTKDNHIVVTFSRFEDPDDEPEQTPICPVQVLLSESGDEDTVEPHDFSSSPKS